MGLDTKILAHNLFFLILILLYQGHKEILQAIDLKLIKPKLSYYEQNLESKNYEHIIYSNTGVNLPCVNSFILFYDLH